MRKFFHIFLIFSLLFGTAGYVVTKHFCEEVLVNISVGHTTTSFCDSSEMSFDCECENEVNHVVIDDDYQLDQQEIKISPALPTLISFIRFLALTPLLEENRNKLHPTLEYPPFTDPDIHISFQSLLL